MKLLNTVHKRKSATITAILIVLLFLLIFFFGLRYMDPPIESGIAVNFGTSEVGSGDVQPTEPVKTVIQEEFVAQEEVSEQEVSEPVSDVESPAEDVLTSDIEESVLIKKKEEERKEELAKEADRLAQEEAEKIAEAKRLEEERIQKEQEEKKRKLDALMGGLNNSEGVSQGGEGDDDQAGDKGQLIGDPNAKGYYGKGGSGGNGDYQLGDRKALSKPKPVYECNEEGLVVVAVEVDRQGKVLSATPGVKGSTTRASCLLLKAQAAALKTQWEPDEKAATKQIGIIKYRFSLTN